MAYVGLPTAVLLHSVTAWIFGLQIARTWWNTSLMAPLFVVSAVLSGTALVTLLALCAERFGKVELPADTRRWLRGFIVVSLVRRPVLRGLRLHHGAVGQRPGRPLGAQPRAAGRTRGRELFWVEWIVGGVIPLAFLLVPRLQEAARRARTGVGCSSSSASTAFRIELVVIGFVNPLTQYPPGNAVGTYNACDDLVPAHRPVPPDLGRVRHRARPGGAVRRPRHPRLREAPCHGELARGKTQR